MKLHLIGCEVILRELCDGLVRSPHQFEVEFLPKGLHDRGAKAMRQEIQARIDAADAASSEAVLLGYGLCGTGIAGLHARSKPLVVPRAHDCITLLMGSRQVFERYFRAHPGVDHRSVGWVERGGELNAVLRDSEGSALTLDGLIARYGDDNGAFLYDELTRYQRAYSQLTYIATDVDPDDRFELAARLEAGEKGWAFERLPGDLRLVRALMVGQWPEEDFLVVPPGARIEASFDDRIVKASEVRA